MIKPEPTHLNSFRYGYGNLTEYCFDYQRYATLSDASIYDGPVGIKKIATGLSDLRALFLRPVHDAFEDNLIPFNNVGRDIDDDDVFNDMLSLSSLHGKNIDGSNIRDEVMYFLRRYMHLKIRDYDESVSRSDEMDILPTFSFSDSASANRMNILPMFIFSQSSSNIFEIYKYIYASSYRIGMNIIENFLASKEFDRNLDIYDFRINILSIPDNEFRIFKDYCLSIPTNMLDGKDILPYVMLGWVPVPEFRIIENINASKGLMHANTNPVENAYKDGNHGNAFDYLRIPKNLYADYPDDINTSKDDPGTDTFYQLPSKPSYKAIDIVSTFIGSGRDIIANEYENIMMRRPLIIVNINEILNIPSGMKIINDMPWETVYPPEKITNKIPLLLGSQYGKIMNSIPTVLGSQYRKILNKIPVVSGPQSGKESIEVPILSGIQYGKTLNSNPVLSGRRIHEIKDVYDFDGMFYGAESDGKTGYELDFDSFGILENKYTIVVNNEMAKHCGKAVMPLYDDNYIYNIYRNIRNNAVYHENEYASKYRAPSHIEYETVSGDMNPRSTDVARIPISGKRKRHHTRTADDDAFFKKDKVSAMLAGKCAWAVKISRPASWDYSIGQHAYRLPKSMFTKDDASSAFRKPKDASVSDSGYNVYRIMKQIYVGFDEYWIYKLPKDLNIYNQLIWIDGKPAPELGNKIPESFNSDWLSGVWVRRISSFNISVNYEQFIYKKVRPVWCANMIIPMSRVNKFSSIDKFQVMLDKLARDIDMLDSTMWASVLKRPAFMQDTVLGMDKKQFQVFIDCENEWLKKYSVKMGVLDNIHIHKKKRKVDTFNDEWVNRPCNLNLTVEPPMPSTKVPKDLNIYMDEWLKRDISHKIYLFKDKWLKKEPSLVYYDYGLFADKYKKPTMISEGLNPLTKENTMFIDFVSSVIREADIRIWFDEIIVTEKVLHDISIGNQLEWLYKTNKKLDLRPEDFGNWVWVYETPDPIQGEPFGIDELLLPENDTQYENFKDIIFDKETLTPRNPVKVIDETTFIAKYPIKHPSERFKELAVDYDASAYDWENYYGIKTEIMHTCFTKYYRIWEAKMFDFSTMTMTQAVNQMLEYMYAWMIDYFPLEELEEAFRVLKLIRWYGESAIIQNSQYIISYEYDILESKLTSGKCHIPNDLIETVGDGKTNDTMYVDASLGVIRNNPTYIGNGDAYVEFYIDNKKNTTFTFSLSNTVGSVNIYINGVLKDQKSFTSLNITYPLPATGMTNVIRIEKPKNHNLNSTFFIGNIKVPYCSFKDLSIEFDTKLRAGNKPLDVIAKKLIAYCQLHADRDKVYDVLMKANLGINETYKKMLEYWKLHHEGKTKGKRLTIKKS